MQHDERQQQLSLGELPPIQYQTALIISLDENNRYSSTFTYNAENHETIAWWLRRSQNWRFYLDNVLIAECNAGRVRWYTNSPVQSTSSVVES